MKAPRDPVKKRVGFYIMRNKKVAGSKFETKNVSNIDLMSAKADRRYKNETGGGVQYLYLDGGRLISSAQIVGNITDPLILKQLETTNGFRQLVHSIGITVEAEGRNQTVDFVLQMYGTKDVHGGGTVLRLPVLSNGMEHCLTLSDCIFREDDHVLGQIRFEFSKPGEVAEVSVRFYLQDGYTAPEQEAETPVDFQSPFYQKILEKSLYHRGNGRRLKDVLEKARRGEDVTIAFIGGSITQGAGAVPIHTACYSYQTFVGFCKLAGKGIDENIHYIKAGVGGTPSELALVRYEEDVLRGGTVSPDLVVVEFAVNDEGDETKGECYDSLVRKIGMQKNHPAVILLFSVFANDWNLQERLSPVGFAYDIPMVSIKDAVVEQFYQKQDRVISKSQFFYDSLHPSNFGHRVMADSLLSMMRQVDLAECLPPVLMKEVLPPIGGDFQNIKRLDRKRNAADAIITCGSFHHIDTVLQAVEMDDQLDATKQFPDNWLHRQGEEPFTLEIACSTLILVYKDSGDQNVGCAEVFVDGEKQLIADPSVNGWTHCNAAIVFRNREKKVYHVEIMMQSGKQNQLFTILGFGYV